MSKHLVKRLRSGRVSEEVISLGGVKHDNRCLEAAETIEKLTREREKIQEALISCAASLAASISLLERGGKEASASDYMFSQMLDDYQRALTHARSVLWSE